VSQPPENSETLAAEIATLEKRLEARTRAGDASSVRNTEQA